MTKPDSLSKISIFASVLTILAAVSINIFPSRNPNWSPFADAIYTASSLIISLLYLAGPIAILTFFLSLIKRSSEGRWNGLFFLNLVAILFSLGAVYLIFSFQTSLGQTFK